MKNLKNLTTKQRLITLIKLKYYGGMLAISDKPKGYVIISYDDWLENGIAKLVNQGCKLHLSQPEAKNAINQFYDKLEQGKVKYNDTTPIQLQDIEQIANKKIKVFNANKKIGVVF